MEAEKEGQAEHTCGRATGIIISFSWSAETINPPPCVNITAAQTHKYMQHLLKTKPDISQAHPLAAVFCPSALGVHTQSSCVHLNMKCILMCVGICELERALLRTFPFIAPHISTHTKRVLNLNFADCD